MSEQCRETICFLERLRLHCELPAGHVGSHSHSVKHNEEMEAYGHCFASCDCRITWTENAHWQRFDGHSKKSSSR